MEPLELLTNQNTYGRNLLNFLVNCDKKGQQSQTEAYLKSRLGLLETYWANIFNTNTLLCQHATKLAKEKYFAEEQYEVLEETYAEVKATLLDRIAAKSAPTLPASAAVTNPSQLVTTRSSLPKLVLPRFSGEPVEWETFRERFSAMVKNDTTLSSVLKLDHLISCLDGEAARRVESLQLIGSNFQVAWETLTKRYDNQRVRLSAHMRRLLNLLSATSKSATEITSLLDGVAVACRAFTLLGRPVQHWDDWLVEIVTSRLDQSIREDWEKTLEGNVNLPTYNALSTFLENRARTLGAASGNGPLVTNQSPSNKRVQTKVTKSISAYHTASKGQLDKPPRPPAGCSLCKERHFLAYCPIFLKMNASEKKAHLGESRTCRNCLRIGHATSTCPSQDRCRAPTCQAWHHTLLHECYKEESSSSVTTQSKKDSVHTYTTSIINEGSVNDSSCTGSMVLLATASVTLESPLGAQLIVRALVDPASEGSFVSEHEVQSLALEKKGNLQSYAWLEIA